MWASLASKLTRHLGKGHFLSDKAREIIIRRPVDLQEKAMKRPPFAAFFVCDQRRINYPYAPLDPGKAVGGSG